MLDNSVSSQTMSSAQSTADVLRSNPLLGELIRVLQPHGRGLRRWSVMRVMRENRKRLSRDIPQKFEEDIERVFRQFSATPDAPLYRPKDTAGEVWALHQERAAGLVLANPS
jgi:hypothetical protein